MVAKSFPRRQVCTKYFPQKFWSKLFYGCKIISSKTGSHQIFSSKKFWWIFCFVAKSFAWKLVCTKNLHRKIMVENFLLLLNRFFENWFAPKIFIKKILFEFFFCFKIISSETGLDQHFHQKNFGRKFFIVAKSFPRKLVSTKNFHQKNFGRNFFIVAKSFPRKLVCTENFHQNKFVRFFFASKSFPRKQDWTKIFIKKSLVENFLLLQNHFLENWCTKKILRKRFGRKYFMVAKSFSRLQVC